MAGVALGDVRRGLRRGTWHAMALGWLLVTRLVAAGPSNAVVFCVVSVALGAIHGDLVWRAWHLVTSTFTCVAGVALITMGWLWWRARLPGPPWRRSFLRGRHGTWWHPRWLCIAGVALGDIDLPFMWQAWRLSHWPGSDALGRSGSFVWQARNLVTSTFELGDIDPHFAWQAWHLWHWDGSVTPQSFAWQAWHLVTSTVTLRGKRGTFGSGLALVLTCFFSLAPELPQTWQDWAGMSRLAWHVHGQTDA